VQELTGKVALAAPQSLTDPDFLRDVLDLLDKLMEGGDLRISLMPMLKIADSYTFQDPRTLAKQHDAFANKHNLFEFLSNTYLLKPETIFLDPIPDDLALKYSYLNDLRLGGIDFFALVPVVFDEALIGVIEVYPQKQRKLTLAMIDRLLLAYNPLNIYFQKARLSYDTVIDNFLKDNCTVLQPAVQWRFNKAARQAICLQPEQSKLEIDLIKFEKVYPVYGAIDVRNSTLNRNWALKQDLKLQIGHLILLLQKIALVTQLELIQQKKSNCEIWLEKIDQDEIFEDSLLAYYLETDIHPFLKELEISAPIEMPEVDFYFSLLDENIGAAFENRRLLEESMKLVVGKLNDSVAEMNREAQQIYPCYFEKFQTDGVEYDFYIGQSITPQQTFFQFHLQSIRLLQLSNMISIARMANDIKAELPVSIELTQLIFLQPHCIDIRFRGDERRFDVEGAYNIRYHIVKKRIDKVHIYGTNERLTMPGKIAIVFISTVDAEELRGHIQYFQKKGFLADDLELLELEPLQGIIGLKALRVGIKYAINI